MRTHDLNHPDYNPLDCPTWAKETLPDIIQQYRGLNGMPDVYRESPSPLSMNVRGIDRYQANQFVVYRQETAEYLYTEYTPLRVDYRRGLLPDYEALAAEVTTASQTDTEKAIDLLIHGGARIKHPSVPPCGKRMPSDRNMDDQALLKNGLGWCNEQARAFVRLCQVSNIPARIIQVFYSNMKDGHCIAEFYADGRWCMADATWLCTFPGSDGQLLSAAQCHDGGDGQRSCGLGYYKRQEEMLKFSDAELNMETPERTTAWRQRVVGETPEYLAEKMGFFGVVNYPLPTC